MRNDVDETIEYRGHEIEIGYETEDSALFDPREHCNIGTLNIAIRNYTYGDKQTDPEDMRVKCLKCDGTGEQPGYDEDSDVYDGYASAPPCEMCDGEGEVSNPVRWAVEVEGATVVLPVYAYIHSGTTFRTSVRLYPPTEDAGGNPFTCAWDSGLAGIIYDTPKGLQDCWGEHKGGKYTGRYLTQDGGPPSVDLIEEILQSEIQIYDDYVTGDIKWYRVEGPVCSDACGGFFPDHSKPYAEEWDHMIEEAKANIDASIEHEEEQSAKIALMMAL